MNKKYAIPLWGIISVLAGLVLSVTGYAFSSDKASIKKDITDVEVRVTTIEQNYVSKDYVKEKIEDHVKVENAKYNELKTMISTQNQMIMFLYSKEGGKPIIIEKE